MTNSNPKLSNTKKIIAIIIALIVTIAFVSPAFAKSQKAKHRIVYAPQSYSINNYKFTTNLEKRSQNLRLHFKSVETAKSFKRMISSQFKIKSWLGKNNKRNLYMKRSDGYTVLNSYKTITYPQTRNIRKNITINNRAKLANNFGTNFGSNFGVPPLGANIDAKLSGNSGTNTVIVSPHPYTAATIITKNIKLKRKLKRNAHKRRKKKIKLLKHRKF